MEISDEGNDGKKKFLDIRVDELEDYKPLNINASIIVSTEQG